MPSLVHSTDAPTSHQVVLCKLTTNVNNLSCNVILISAQDGIRSFRAITQTSSTQATIISLCLTISPRASLHNIILVKSSIQLPCTFTAHARAASDLAHLQIEEAQPTTVIKTGSASQNMNAASYTQSITEFFFESRYQNPYIQGDSKCATVIILQPRIIIPITARNLKTFKSLLLYSFLANSRRFYSFIHYIYFPFIKTGTSVCLKP